MTEPLPAPTAWSPLAQPLFRALWIATVISNVGTWIHEVGAGWDGAAQPHVAHWVAVNAMDDSTGDVL